MNHETLMLIFVGLTGLALVTQAIIMMAFFITIRKTVSSVQTEVQELRGSITPVLAKSKELMDRVGPKLESVATDLAELAHNLRDQGEEIQLSTNEILQRVNRQTGRIDEMFSSVLDGVEHATHVVADSVSKPVRQVSAMISSARAFITVLTTGKQPGRKSSARADQDLFV